MPTEGLTMPNSKRLSTFLVLILSIVLTVHIDDAFSAQTTSGGSDGIGSVYSHCGLLLVVNKGTSHFTVELDGSDIKVLPVDKTNYWLIDGILTEANIIDKNQIGPDAAKLTGEDLLLRHMHWESEFIAKQNGWPYTAPGRIKIKLSSNRPAIGWITDTAGKLTILGEKIGKMVFVTTVVEDKIFLITSPVPVDSDHMSVFRYIANSLDTIKINSEALDITTIANRIKKEKNKGIVCSKRKNPNPTTPSRGSL